MPKRKCFNVDNNTIVKTPSMGTVQLISIALFVVMVLLTGVVWNVVLETNWTQSFLWLIVQLLLIGIVLVPIHELIHALAYPGTDNEPIVIGYLPQAGSFYAGFNGQMSRNRAIAVYVLPFATITVMPFVIVAAGGLHTNWIALTSIVNAGISGADLYFAWLLITQVPRGAIVQNNGWETYWRVPS